MGNMASADCSQGRMIRILFPKGIPELSVSLDGTQLIYGDVKYACFKHLRESGLSSGSYVEDGISADILPAFGLVKSENESKWLLPNHVFGESDNKQVYKFKLRHRPPSSRIYVEGNLLSEFFVLQALDDFLKGDLGKSMVTAGVPRDTILKLVIFALLVPSSVPVRNSDVIDKKHEFQGMNTFSYKKLFSKEIYNQLNNTNNAVDRLIDHYWCYSYLCDALKARKGETVFFYKKEFIQLLLKCYPSYCFERYKVIEAYDFKAVEVKLVLFNEPPGSKQQTGIFIDEVRQCALEEVDNVTLNDDGPRPWLVEINCKVPKVQDKALLFDDKDIATSFITMLQGYMTLCVRPDVNICRELPNPSFQIRHNLRSFCSMTHSAAVELLRNENRHRAESQMCKFLIYENVDMLSEDRFQIATDSHGDEPAGRIRYSNKNGFQLYSSLGSKNKADHFALRTHLTTTLYGQQLRPDFVLQNVNPESMFYLEKKATIQATVSEEFTENWNAPSFILEGDLGREMGNMKNHDQHLKRQVVPSGDEKRLKVELVVSKAHHVEALFAGMTKLAGLYRLHRGSILGFYGIVYTQSFCNTFVFEHSTFGDLTDFMARNKGQVSTCQKMKLAYEVTKIFCILTQRESTSSVPQLHGNLRGNNFWVFRKHGRYYLKLGDPGLVSYYNTLDLKKPDNDQRIPWLSPERQTHLKEVTIASECYAVATTIAEIFHGTDDFRSVLQKLGPEQIRKLMEGEEEILLKDIFAHKDSKIPHPEFPTSDDQAVTESVKDVTLKLWDRLTQCWHYDPKERPSPLELKNQIHDLELESSCIVEDTVLDHFKAVLKQMHKGESEVNDRISKLSSTKECNDFLKNKKHSLFVGSDMFQISYKELGKGHYGRVYAGTLSANGRVIEVAIKINNPPKDKHNHGLEAGQRIQDFTKEFKISAELDHPNIVKALHWTLIVERSCYGMIMEKMDSGSLANYARRNNADMKTLLGLALDIARGMQYCEAKGVVHCDLAARNVLLNRDAATGALVAKVSDFGLAKILHKEKDYCYVAGETDIPIYWYAPEYLAFEINGIKSTGINYTTTGDIWAYGTTLWELFTKGLSPYNQLQTMMKQTLQSDMPYNVYELLYNLYVVDHKRLPKQVNKPTRRVVSQDIYDDVMMACWHVDKDKRPPFIEIQEMISRIRETY